MPHALHRCPRCQQLALPGEACPHCRAPRKHTRGAVIAAALLVLTPPAFAETPPGPYETLEAPTSLPTYGVAPGPDPDLGVQALTPTPTLSPNQRQTLDALTSLLNTQPDVQIILSTQDTHGIAIAHLVHGDLIARGLDPTRVKIAGDLSPHTPHHLTFQLLSPSFPALLPSPSPTMQDMPLYGGAPELDLIEQQALLPKQTHTLKAILTVLSAQPNMRLFFIIQQYNAGDLIPWPYLTKATTPTVHIDGVELHRLEAIYQLGAHPDHSLIFQLLSPHF